MHISTAAWLLAASSTVASQGVSDPREPARIVGMYVHQHWPYNRPYAARTWTLEDWRGYSDGLHRLGYNAVLIWPVLETMPEPLTASDRANLDKIARVIDLLHDEFGMRVYVALCPNVIAKDEEARKATFQKRHFFACDARVDPGDDEAMDRMMERRRRVLAPLARMDGVAIIDSDPGGYVDSPNAEFVSLLMRHRRLLDGMRPGIELVYWMHAGWLGYGRFYKTGVLTFSTDAEHTDMLRQLKAADPAPWGVANGLAYAESLGIADRVISFNYGRIEGEPSFPMTNFGSTSAYEGGASPGPRGVMGNAQTHCVQLPNTFAFARGAAGKPVTEADYVQFADDLIPGLGREIVAGWTALSGPEPDAMRSAAAALDRAARAPLTQGPLKGLLFGSPRRFLTDLAMMLRTRAGFEGLRRAMAIGGSVPGPLDEFATAASAWQRRHGYENSWWWPGLDETLRKLDAPEVNAVLGTRLDPFKTPALKPGETAFEHIAAGLLREESNTPRLLAALRAAAHRLKRGGRT